MMMKNNVNWSSVPKKGNPIFTPVKLPTKKSVSNIKKKNLTWNQAVKKYPKITMFGDADRDGKLNMFDCKPFDKTRHGFTKFKRKTMRDVESCTAAERFGGRNIKKLKRLGQGRDRNVYELDKDKVIKIAKGPGGMRQNNAENDWYFNSSGIRPNFHEAGKDYVVMEKVKKLSPEKRRKMNKVSNEVMAKQMNARNPYNSEKEKYTYESLSKEFPKQEEDFSSIMDYTIAPADIVKSSSWGEKDGDIVLVDAGGINQDDLLREHRITKMKERLREIPNLDNAEEDRPDMVEDAGQRSALNRLRNERAILKAEVEEWEDVKEDRRRFKNKGKEDDE